MGAYNSGMLSDLTFTSMKCDVYEIIGARKRSTKEGTLTGAFIACRSSRGIRASYFDNDREYGVSINMTWENLLKEYNQYLFQGFVAMSRNDIQKTSNL